MKLTSQSFIHRTIASGLIAMACYALTPFARAQSLSTEGVVRLANSTVEYFSQGKGEAIVLLPGGTLTIGYLDAMATALKIATPSPTLGHTNSPTPPDMIRTKETLT